MSTFRLVLVPGLITLAVTLLRLVGELNGWSPTFFGAEAGGGGAIVGITWLVPLFGIYFAWKLHRSGAVSASWKTLGFGALGIVAFLAVSFGASMAFGIDPNQPSLGTLWVTAAASVVGAAVILYGVPVLGRVLVSYGLIARIPVLLVMLVAILGNWGTHYDVVPPGVPEMAPFAKWFLIGVVPQLSFWMAFTIIVGAFFAGIALAVSSLRRASVPAAP
jgi:hypothetical protein